MIKVVTTDEMRIIERAADKAGVSYSAMMENAGRAVSAIVTKLLEPRASKQNVVVLAGKGNNGSDGIVASRLLKEQQSIDVSCYLSSARGVEDEVYVAARESGVFFACAADDTDQRILKRLIGDASIIIDALLGTGTFLPVRGDVRKILQTVKTIVQDRSSLRYAQLMPFSATHVRPSNAPRATIVAVDCPSGLDCDSGAIDTEAIRADITVTLGSVKRGHLLFPGADYTGELLIADIGLSPNMAEWESVRMELATADDIRPMLPARPRSGHKGTFGKAVIVGGSTHFAGAPVLAAKAAYRAGAGLVQLVVPEAIRGIVCAAVPEAIWLALDGISAITEETVTETLLDKLGDFHSLLVGPGLGQGKNAHALVKQLLNDYRALQHTMSEEVNSAPQLTTQPKRRPPGLVVDADGLNIISTMEAWWGMLPPRTILTPHVGEMSRLTKIGKQEILQDRFGVAVNSALAWGCVVVLKGAFTIVADPDGSASVIPFASDALAKAGTGDVLAGCIAGLLAQGAAPYAAAVAGAFLHGLVGQLLAEKGSARSVIASDVLDMLPQAFERLEQRSN